ncbi:unnamed protein product [Prorocentrum cordatum]|uniref:Phospholipase B-like n=1 Tax=Prorocentrum cordatum TaxID=2364126 RepID=A0ABN9XEJ7_9DINO|nr:unnamed protein product [Polarella glacialis]
MPQPPPLAAPPAMPRHARRPVLAAALACGALLLGCSFVPPAGGEGAALRGSAQDAAQFAAAGALLSAPEVLDVLVDALAAAWGQLP